MRTGLPRASNAARNAERFQSRCHFFQSFLVAASMAFAALWSQRPLVMQGHASPWRSPGGWRTACWPFPSPSNKAAALHRDPSTGKRAQSRAVRRQTPHHPAAMETHTGIRHANRTLHQLVAINFPGRGLLGPNPCRRPNGLRFPGDKRSPPSGQGENPGVPKASQSCDPPLQ